MTWLYIDYEKCVGCELCAMRCSLEKTGMVKPAESRIHVVKSEDEGVMMPAVCRHCDEPECLPACPVENCIQKDPATQLVSIDAELCIGCKKCVRACPYEGPVKIPAPDKKTKNVKVICDLCNGHPVCVDICPTGTLQFVELDETMQAQKQQGEAGLVEVLEVLSRKVGPRTFSKAAGGSHHE